MIKPVEEVTGDHKFFAYYGSLRKGEYNYNRLIRRAEGCKYMATTSIPGFVMGAQGKDYPFAVEGAGTIVVDLFHIKNDYVRDYIDLMETGAGYYPVEIEVEDGAKYVMYLFHSKYLPGMSPPKMIDGGDWRKYLEFIKPKPKVAVAKKKEVPLAVEDIRADWTTRPPDPMPGMVDIWSWRP